jgi:hypothetical protein
MESGAGIESISAFNLGEIGEPTPISTRPVITEQLVYIDLRDERVQDAIGRISRAIREEYPEAEFVSYIGTNPLGVYTEVYTASAELKNILDIVDDKLGDLHVAAGVNIILAPKRKAQALAA